MYTYWMTCTVVTLCTVLSGLKFCRLCFLCVCVCVCVCVCEFVYLPGPSWGLHMDYTPDTPGPVWTLCRRAAGTQPSQITRQLSCKWQHTQTGKNMSHTNSCVCWRQHAACLISHTHFHTVASSYHYYHCLVLWCSVVPIWNAN